MQWCCTIRAVQLRVRGLAAKRLRWSWWGLATCRLALLVWFCRTVHRAVHSPFSLIKCLSFRFSAPLRFHHQHTSPISVRDSRTLSDAAACSLAMHRLPHRSQLRLLTLIYAIRCCHDQCVPYGACQTTTRTSAACDSLHVGRHCTSAITDSARLDCHTAACAGVLIATLTAPTVHGSSA
jgi:hypothetical protein